MRKFSTVQLYRELLDAGYQNYILYSGRDKFYPDKPAWVLDGDGLTICEYSFQKKEWNFAAKRQSPAAANANDLGDKKTSQEDLRVICLLHALGIMVLPELNNE